MSAIHTLHRVHDLLFKEGYYYLYSMSIYHVLVILFMYLFGEIPVKVFYKLTLNVQQIISFTSLNIQDILRSEIFIIIILILDLIFLCLIAIEFKPRWLTMKTIGFVELMILSLGLVFPYFREIMIFLSINSITMFITYKIIKNVWFAKYVFITGSYIFIFRLVIYPICHW